MKTENLFSSFLILTQMYFRENDNIDFYAEKLGITPGELHQVILSASDMSFEDWLALNHRATL